MKLKSAIVAKRNNILVPHFILHFCVLAIFADTRNHPTGCLTLIHRTDLGLLGDIKSDAKESLKEKIVSGKYGIETEIDDDGIFVNISLKQ